MRLSNETSERDQKIFHLVLLGYPEKFGTDA